MLDWEVVYQIVLFCHRYVTFYRPVSKATVVYVMVGVNVEVNSQNFAISIWDYLLDLSASCSRNE